MSVHADRLTAFRSELSRHGVQGFWLPRTDEHASEYLPARAERVAWLTGFTGSWGQVVVLADTGAVFVDGRYTAQAERELDHALWQRVSLVDEPPSVWLGKHLPEGSAIGYDPLLVKRGEVERLRKAVDKRGGRLVPLAANPVDAIWTDRPAAPAAKVVSLEATFTGETREQRLDRMAAKVAESGAGNALITACDSIAWLLNLRGSDIPYNPLFLSWVLLGADGGCRLFVDPAKVEGLPLGNRVSVEPYTALGEALDTLGRSGAKVMVDPATTNAGHLDRIAAAGGTVVEGDDPVILAKATKNATEIQGAIAAHRRDGAAMADFLAWIDRTVAAGEPIDEMGAADKLDALRARDPLARGPSFPSISAHGPNAAYPHYRAVPESNRKLEPGTLYLIDSGGQYLDATTDVTRTVALGEPTGEMRDRFTRVLKGMIAVATAIFPKGTTGAQIDPLARTALWNAGLDFDHGTGHGVGAYLCVHEGPARIAKTGHTVALQPGMILSDEPGYYKVGHYGIRIENLLVVEEAPAVDGGERPMLRFLNLTLVPIDRRLIDTAMLTAAEHAWIDAYHAKVRDEVLPLVTAEARNWLLRATAPL